MSAAERFPFGANWQRFLAHVDAPEIEHAVASLSDMLELRDLAGRRFLDAGSGSGLFSLAARRLGARVFSFDVDPQAVACTQQLKRRFCAEDTQWAIHVGSILDPGFVGELGQFDVVYSWGVLHHTGALWQSLERVGQLVAPAGRLYVAIYNDQGRGSRRWAKVKRWYNVLPVPLPWLLLGAAFVRLWGPTMLRDACRGNPLRTWTRYPRQNRGMSPWYDVVDWVGGYPFEVARPEEVHDFCRQRGFQLLRLKTCGGGHGCNEYVFVRASQ